jgi:hypothetical protein
VHRGSSNQSDVIGRARHGGAGSSRFLAGFRSAAPAAPGEVNGFAARQGKTLPHKWEACRQLAAAAAGHPGAPHRHPPCCGGLTRRRHSRIIEFRAKSRPGHVLGLSNGLCSTWGPGGTGLAGGRGATTCTTYYIRAAHSPQPTANSLQLPQRAHVAPAPLPNHSLLAPLTVGRWWPPPGSLRTCQPILQ